MEEVFFDPTRIKLPMGGERSGKSFHGALQLVCRHFMGELFWLVAEEYETCNPEMEYIREFLGSLGAVKSDSWPREGSKSITTWEGVLIETRTASDYRRIAEKAPDAVLGCEVGRWRWESFLRVSGRLAEKRAWAWLGGSFEGSMGWQAEKHMQWAGANIEEARSFSIPTWANEFIFPLGEEDPEIQRLKRSFPADRFEERYGGRPVPPSGRVYNEFTYITHVSEEAEYKPGTAVDIWIDPGHAGAYVVLAVQQIGNELINVIDTIYVQRLTNAEVINMCSRRPWWKDKTASGVIDIQGGSQHHGERSPIEAWQEVAGIYLEGDYIHISDQIQRVHTFLRPDSLLGRPPLLVHPRCLGLIAEMGAGKHPIEGMGTYRYRTDAAGNVLSEKPLDENNHACSALAYGLIKRFGHVKRVLGESINYRSERTRLGTNYRRGAPKPGIDPELWTPEFQYEEVTNTGGER